MLFSTRPRNLIDLQSQLSHHSAERINPLRQEAFVMPLQVETKQADSRFERDAPWGGVPRESDSMRNFRNPVMESARER